MYLIETRCSQTLRGKFGSFFVNFGVVWAFRAQFRFYPPVLVTELVWILGLPSCSFQTSVAGAWSAHPCAHQQRGLGILRPTCFWDSRWSGLQTFLGTPSVFLHVLWRLEALKSRPRFLSEYKHKRKQAELNENHDLRKRGPEKDSSKER